jgi:L-ribulose-5-phosphate 3-epimerase
MQSAFSRRRFLQSAAAAAAAVATHRLLPALLHAAGADAEPFKISLAEWSLNKSLKAGKLTNLDFPRVAKHDFGIEAVEFVDQFFRDKAQDAAYLKELKQRASDEGVHLHLIMVDTNGPLGAADKAKRDVAVEKTFTWIDAAKALGCRAVRVNAYGDGEADELRERIVESCVRLADHAAPQGIDVCIENHGRLSSDPEWLASVMRAVNRPNFGTLPDFGNFPDSINHYDAVETLMPWAKAVSAKTGRFDIEGMDEKTDYFRMMRIVRDAGWTGWVGIESGAPTAEGEADSIRRTRDLLIRVREAQKRCQPIFNGRDLAGWTKIEGGDWTVEDGVLVGRNGQNWTTNPEKSGSWLSTEREYGDFRLELQFTVNERGNSGIHFRSAREKNPSFTGYELQIFDAPERPPSKGGPLSIYDVAPPARNVIRPAGRWNTVTLIARGPRIIAEVNGERVHDVELSRSLRGYIGLQNHDTRSVVKFRNLRLEEL